MDKKAGDDAFRTAVWLAEHLEDFEFRTIKACVFRAQVRRWYYGRRNGDQAERLVRRFHILFSGNFLLDSLVEPIWRMASCLREGKKLLEKMDLAEEAGAKKQDGEKKLSEKWIEKVTELKELPRGDIVGKNLYCYLRTEENLPAVVNQRLRLDSGTAARKLKAGREELLRLCMVKRLEYRTAGVSLLNFVLSLLTIAVLCFAVPASLYLFLRLKQGGIQSLPMAQIAGNKVAWSLVAVWATGIVWTLFLIPRCVMSLVGNLVWILWIKKECQQDIEFLRYLDQAVSERIDGYCQVLQERLKQAEDKELCLQGPVLEQVRRWILPEVKASWWSRSWNLEPLQKALQRYTFGKRGKFVFLLLLVFCLGQLLMMQGDTLRSLISNFP